MEDMNGTNKELISRGRILQEIQKLLKSPYANQPQYGLERRGAIEVIAVMVEAIDPAYDPEEKIKLLESRLEQCERQFEKMSGTDTDVECWGKIKAYKDAIEILTSKAGRR